MKKEFGCTNQLSERLEFFFELFVVVTHRFGMNFYQASKLLFIGHDHFADSFVMFATLKPSLAGHIKFQSVYYMNLRLSPNFHCFSFPLSSEEDLNLLDVCASNVY